MNTTIFFFNDTATTEIYTLSLHDALPIYFRITGGEQVDGRDVVVLEATPRPGFHPQSRSAKLLPHFRGDRKSTRLNSSHLVISYAVFCLKKKRRHGVPEVVHVLSVAL